MDFVRDFLSIFLSLMTSRKTRCNSREMFCFANEKPGTGMSQHCLVHFQGISSFDPLILMSIFPMVDLFLLAGLYVEKIVCFHLAQYFCSYCVTNVGYVVVVGPLLR